MRNDNTSLEGRLQSFIDGAYTLLVDGRPRTVREAEIRTISFRSEPTKSGSNAQVIADLIGQLRQPRPGVGVDPTVIDRLAEMGPDVVEPLLAAVCQDRAIYQSVGRAFKQMGPEMLPKLIDVVRKDGTGSARLPVWYALKASGVDSVPVLVELLTDSSPSARRLAAEVLYSLSIQSGVSLPKSLVQPLVAALDDTDANVRSQMPLILGRIGSASDVVIPTLIKSLKCSRHQPIRSNAVIALGYIGAKLKQDDADLKRIVEALSEAVLEDASEGVRAYSAMYLGQLGSKAEAATTALMRATDDKDDTVRKYADAALNKIGATLKMALAKAGIKDQQAVALMVQMTGRDPKAARVASQALAAQEPTKLLLDAVMIAVRDDRENRYWPRMAYLLGKWDKRVLAELDRFVADDHYRVRRTVAMAWGEMSLQELPKAVSTLLHDQHVFVRMSTADSLVKLSKRGSPELRKAIAPLLIEALADEELNREYWWRAAKAVRQLALAHPEAIDALIRAMKTAKNEGFRETAARELGALGRDLKVGDEDLARIVQALAEAVGREPQAGARRYIVRVLGSMGPRARAALPALRKASDDPRESVSKAAAEALRRIEDR